MSKEVVDWIEKNKVAIADLSDNVYNEGYDDGCGDGDRYEGKLRVFNDDLLAIANNPDNDVVSSVRRKTAAELIQDKKAAIQDIINDSFDMVLAREYSYQSDLDRLFDEIIDLFVDTPQDAVVAVGNVTVECKTVSELIAAKEPAVVTSVSVPVTPHVEGECDILRAVIRSAYLDGYVSGARGGDASDYDIAENAVDNLFAVMKNRKV